MKKQTRDLRRRLGPGWTISHTGSGHLKLTHESGFAYFTSATPSCPFAHANAVAQAKRMLRDATERANAPEA